MTRDPVDIEAAATVLRTLANPARLRIALYLLQGEQAVSELEAQLGIRQPTLSQHLAELRDAGLVITRRESRVIFYALAAPAPQRLIASLLEGFGGPPARPRPASRPVIKTVLKPVASFAIVEADR